MPEGDGLRRLEMGEAGHDGRRMLLRLVEERGLQSLDRAIEPVDGVAYPEPEIGRDLVVARARGVQPARPARRSTREARLDVQVDVFVLGAKWKGTALDLAADLF